jgi:hypothetical protein
MAYRDRRQFRKSAHKAARERSCVVLLVTLACTWACSASKGTTTAPSPTPTPTTTFSLTGRVTGGGIFAEQISSRPISGATVAIVDGPNAGVSTTTDVSGNYTFSALQQSGFTVRASANGYISQGRGVTLTSNQALNFTLTQPPGPIVLTGRVTDITTSAPISGATVSINGRYRGPTDSSGYYRVTGLLDYGRDLDFTYVSANGYSNDYRYIRGTTQNVHLYRIERITAGDSKLLTVAPDDTLCLNSVQDTPGLGQDYVCRSVRVVAPSDGVITVEALSAQGGVRPPLEVEAVGVSPCCSERMGNPTSIPVTAGTEIVVNVEMTLGSTTSQSFVVNTSIAPQ